MSYPVGRPASLSFRPKSSRRLPNASPSSGPESNYHTVAARTEEDTRPGPTCMVEKEKILQDIARLATRPCQLYGVEQDMDLAEARRLIKLEEANAMARNDLFTGGEVQRKKLVPRARSRGTGRGNRPSQIRDDSPSEEDGLDDLNRLISTSESDAEDIASEVDAEFVGVGEFLKAEIGWQESQEDKCAVFKKAVIAARNHGDYLSRFHPHTYDELAATQQDLFQLAGNGNVPVEARRDSLQGMIVSKSGGCGWKQDFPTQNQAAQDEAMADAQDCGSYEQENTEFADEDSMEIE